MTTIPKDSPIDSTLPLLRTGYPYLQKRFKHFNSPIFQMRLLGEKAVCIHGKEAAEIFYDTSLFRRKGSVPKRIQKSLFGQQSVQGLDGEAHRRRKEMFMSLMSKERIQQLMDLCAGQWQVFIPKWEREKRLVVLLEEVEEILFRAICQWTGVPAREEEAGFRTEQLAARVDSFGGVGPRYWRGRLARRETEKWMKGIVNKIRSGALEVPKDTAAYVFAHHQDEQGNLLEAKVAAVELLNVIRPFVAVAYYVVFAALALHEHPEQRQKLLEEGEEYARMFVQEVRRYYPFVPLLGARVARPFDWQGHHFKEGRLVLLDVYGTLHDSELWEQPEEFRPERFRSWQGSPFDFIPQGGGDHYLNHRCAGEWITIGAAKVSLQFLVNLHYEVPKQNLKVSLSRMPTYPKSGFILQNIQRRGEGVYMDQTTSLQATAGDRAAVAKRGGCPYHQKEERDGKKKDS